MSDISPFQFYTLTFTVSDAGSENRCPLSAIFFFQKKGESNVSNVNVVDKMINILARKTDCRHVNQGII